MSSWDVIPLNKLDNKVKYSIDSKKKSFKKPTSLNCDFLHIDEYSKKFKEVIKNIKDGNTYLLNLTSPTIIHNKLSLEDIYNNAQAKYKILYKDKFVSFSPETFIKINNNQLSTYPMKGTIDATIPNAEKLILNNKKELAEHIMVVDLLRNDLNLVSKNVRVEKFRYIDKINAGNKELLQVSSKIVGDLDNNWNEKIGDIILPLLPAGSISGTPKKMTIKLIEKIEKYDRGYFSGIWGVYDGNTLDSSILIRFIEKNNNKFIYKSGGGITIDSNLQTEYKEMQDKVYIP